ncbi:MAG: tetratricopeptide repeat protein [Planctomycetes bacterium]|nr:tetratricopeptide repeat protein [Planctomycetota bacterium]
MQKTRILLIIFPLFIAIFLISCTAAIPLQDPLSKGADLPEVLISEYYWNNFTYSSIKQQEAIELLQSEHADENEIRNALLHAASYARTGLMQAEFEATVANHELYQNLLDSIAGYSETSETGNIFINRMICEYEQFLSNDRTDANLMYLLARALFLSNITTNDNRAIKICMESLKRLDSEHYQTLYLLANILHRHNEYEQAIRFYSFAFELQQDVLNTEALKQIAKVYTAQGKIEEAISFYQQYTKHTPISRLLIEDFENLANLYLSLGDLETAEYILAQQVPSQIAASNKCKHYKLLGMIKLEILDKLNREKSEVNNVELEEEKDLIIRSAKFTFEQFLTFYPKDVLAKSMLDKLNHDYKLN